MTIDTSKCLRVKASIDATLVHVTTNDYIGLALPDAYTAMRDEVVLGISDPLVREEFDRLFPDWDHTRDSVMRNDYASSGIRVYNAEARALLARLSGWLDGYVQDAQQAHEARAYAEARMRIEGSAQST